MSILLSARRSTIACVVTLVFTTITANVAMATYMYVADIDNTQTTSAYVNLPVNAQTIGTAPNHSLFEMSMSDDSVFPAVIEVGVTTDLSLNGDTNPHWFVFSWRNGFAQGYDDQSHFVSAIGSFWSTPLTLSEGTSARVGFVYSASNWNLYLSGTLAGYFPGSEWSGAFTASVDTEVFGEAYTTGTYYPSLNGTVSGYSSVGGGQLSTLSVYPPYTQSNATGTGFIASGPVPEPSTWVMLVETISVLVVTRRKRMS